MNHSTDVWGFIKVTQLLAHTGTGRGPRRMAPFYGWELRMPTLPETHNVTSCITCIIFNNKQNIQTLKLNKGGKRLSCYHHSLEPYHAITRSYKYSRSSNSVLKQFQEAPIVLGVAILASLLSSLPFLWPSKTFKVMIFKQWLIMTIGIGRISSTLFSPSWYLVPF